MQPRDIYSKINEILRKEKFLHTEPNKLIELGKKAKCKEVNIRVRGALSIYKFDIDSIFPFFSQGNQNSLCDYFIFYPKDNELFIFLCNLKSDKIGNSHEQIYAGYIFSKFIIENASRILGGKNFPDTLIQFRAIHFNTKTPKRTGNPRNIKYSKYQNELKYLSMSCKDIADLDILSKIP